MSVDLDPQPGLPLLTELFCTSTGLKLKKVITCNFPDALYNKKSFYGGLAAIAIGVVELLLLAFFVLLCFKMRRDITKYFLVSVYLPLGLSTLFKIACGVYGFIYEAYGFFYMVFLMFFNFFYTTAVVSAAIGSVFYLAGMIIIARRRKQFSRLQMWTCFLTVLFFSILISSSYWFIAQKWNQLPAGAIWLTYVFATIGILALVIAGLLTFFLCTNPDVSNDSITCETPDVCNAKARLGYACLFIIFFNVPQWFEIYVKCAEMFTPYSWLTTLQKNNYYKNQAVELLTFDTLRIFMSLILYLSMFLNSSIRYAIYQWIYWFKNRGTKKVFATQTVPLLQEVVSEPVKEKEKPADLPADPPAPPSNAVVPVETTNTIYRNPPPPPHYSNYTPGMIQFPPNMQTTIVYTPPIAYSNPTVIEELK